jgi:hypothetical protein
LPAGSFVLEKSRFALYSASGGFAELLARGFTADVAVTFRADFAGPVPPDFAVRFLVDFVAGLPFDVGSPRVPAGCFDAVFMVRLGAVFDARFDPDRVFALVAAMPADVARSMPASAGRLAPRCPNTTEVPVSWGPRGRPMMPWSSGG